MASDADNQQAPVAPAHRITFFGVERPVDGATVFVKPLAAEPEVASDEATDATS